MKAVPWLIAGLVAATFTACSDGGSDFSVAGGTALAIGDPIGGADGQGAGGFAGLPASVLEAFFRGRDLALKEFTPSEGLGPFYNAVSCHACHEVPTVGGSAPNYRNFYLAAAGFPGIQFPIVPLPSFVVAAYGNVDPLTGFFDGARVAIPDTFFGVPVAVAQRNAPPTFGVGLFEFVHDADILANADPDDVDGDGISGRTNTDGMGNIGRLGFKCQANHIESFIRGAIQNQMGLTTNPVEGSGAIVNLASHGMPQVSSSLDDPTTDTDAVPDPEVSVSDFADLITFCRFLAPPTKKPFGSAETHGEMLFEQIGCAKCHIPTLPSDLGPLDAYTDLLIHDMGPALADGISMGTPQTGMVETNTLTTDEWRTQPLWGVSLHAPYLHDGRADTLHDAILMHGGEGQAPRDAYSNLSNADQLDILAFLEAL